MAAPTLSVLITGANRGLGLEMVKQMVQCQPPTRTVLACCRDPDGPRAEALRALAKKHPDQIRVIHMDTTDLCSIKQSAQQVGSELGAGGLNLLINNAGMLIKSDMLKASPEDMQTSFNTNVSGPMNIIQEFLPHLQTAAKASATPGMSCSKAAVINISSLLGSMAAVSQTYGYFSAVSYRVSKAGLNMLTLCAAEELKEDGILCASLHPGWVRTDMGGEESVVNMFGNVFIVHFASKSMNWKEICPPTKGDIDVQTSVQGMMKVMASLTEQQNGAFLDFRGQSIPW